jgi:hypothetical protein
MSLPLMTAAIGVVALSRWDILGFISISMAAFMALAPGRVLGAEFACGRRSVESVRRGVRL